MENRFGCAGTVAALLLGATLAGGAMGIPGTAGASHHDHAGDHDHGKASTEAHAGHDHAKEGTAAHAEHGHAPGHHDATASHRFEDPEHWAGRFENPERAAWQRPDEVVAALVTRDDLLIADIGSATGYFPVRFARAVPQGIVYGADIEPDMVRYLNDRARREGVENLVSVLAGPEGPHLPRPVDLVFVCNTYHHLNDRVEYLKRLAGELNPGARVAIVDYRLESEMGPAHKLDPTFVEEEMVAAGYTPVERHDFLPEQYFLVFSAPGGSGD